MDLAGLALFWSMLGVCSTIASIFLAALWKDDLRERLGVQDSFVEWLNFTLDVCNFGALPAGFVVDRYGPLATMSGAAALHGAGYAGLLLAIQGRLPPAAAFLCMALVGQGAIWTVMSVLRILGQLVVPADKGKAVGLAMTWFSLAPVVVRASAVRLLGDPSVTVAFYGVCGLLAVGAGLAGASVLLLLPPAARRGQRRGASLGMPLAVAVSFAASVAPAVVGSAEEAVALFLPASLASCLLLAVLARGRGTAAGQPGASAGAPAPAPGASELLESHGGVNGDARLVAATMLPVPAVTLAEALGELRFWLVFALLGLLCGSGMEVSNHLENLAGGAGWSTAEAVALFAVGNSLARLLLGCFSDWLARWVSRGTFLVACTFAMMVGLGLLVLLPHSQAAVRAGVLLCALAFGSPWILVPAVEMEWYGDAHFGRIHGVMMLASVSGVAAVRLEALLLPGRMRDILAVAAVACAAAGSVAAAAALRGRLRSGLDGRGGGCSLEERQAELRAVR